MPDFQEQLCRDWSSIETVPQLYVNGKFIGNFDAVNNLNKGHKLSSILEEADGPHPTTVHPSLNHTIH